MELIGDIWRSFRALPLWVQAWVALILAPANMAGVFFWDNLVGQVGFWLGVLGMAPNLYFMVRERGLSKIMSLPHLAPWTAMVIWLLAIMLGDDPANGAAAVYAWALIAINTVSLAFDYRDALAWRRGDKAPAGR